MTTRTNVAQETLDCTTHITHRAGASHLSTSAPAHGPYLAAENVAYREPCQRDEIGFGETNIRNRFDILLKSLF